MSTGVVFDLDGVIWDIRSHVADVLGLDRSSVRYSLTGGGNVLTLARQAGVTPDKLGRLLAECRDVARPEVPATLDRLAAKGCRLAVATSLSRRLAKPLLDALELTPRFDAVITPGAGRRSKPAPDSLLAAADGMNARIYWYVGDTPNDEEAARAAGWQFAWASYGYGPRPPRVDAEIASIRDLPAAIGLS